MLEFNSTINLQKLALKINANLILPDNVDNNCIYKNQIHMNETCFKSKINPIYQDRNYT